MAESTSTNHVIAVTFEADAGPVRAEAAAVRQELESKPINVPLKGVWEGGASPTFGSERQHAQATGGQPTAATATPSAGGGGGGGFNGALAEFERRLAADTDDHQARLDLAKALAGHGRFEAAADHLLHIIERDRAWNDEAARKQLLTIFEAAGPGSEVARSGRRRLSAILFS